MHSEVEMIAGRKEIRFFIAVGCALILMGMPMGMGFAETGQATLGLTAASEAPSAPGPVPGTQSQETHAAPSRGAGKEEVRGLWGDPAEVRKIRTCFGWQEEWIYRGDQKRYGAEERTLLFDEGEVLSEIK
jgi:hypothetical protein